MNTEKRSKLKIPYPIIVEGKYDRAAILNVADNYEIKECAENGKYLVITSSNDSISATFKAVENTK